MNPTDRTIAKREIDTLRLQLALSTNQRTRSEAMRKLERIKASMPRCERCGYPLNVCTCDYSAKSAA